MTRELASNQIASSEPIRNVNRRIVPNPILAPNLKWRDVDPGQAGSNQVFRQVRRSW